MKSPLEKQYLAIKGKYPDAILFFRVGDYYETFNKDAEITAEKTGLPLVRNKPPFFAGTGFPHYQLDTHMRTIVKAGYRVAICDQLEDPKTAQGIVKRGVTEVCKPE